MVDCLFIGHNEIPTNDYMLDILQFGEKSEIFRNNRLGTVKYGNQYFSATDIYNYAHRNDSDRKLSFTDTLGGAIAFLASYINKKGITFKYFNSFRGQKEDIKEMIEKEEIGLIAIPTTLYVAAAPIVEIICYIRSIDPDIKIAVGGPFIYSQIRKMNYLTINYLFRSIGADYYIYSNEGEEALYKLICFCKGQYSDINRIHNIFYNLKGKYIFTYNIDENNPLEDMTVDWGLFKEPKKIILKTANSCPFHCKFCTYPEHAGHYKYLGVEEVVKQMEQIDNKDIKCIHIIDDTFNIPKERFKEILLHMKNNRYRFGWNSFLRCQYVDEEIVSLMKDTNCTGVFLGIESANQEILENMNKGVMIKDYEKGIGLLNQYGIDSVASFVVGFPGENEKSVNETIQFINHCKPTIFKPHMWFCDNVAPIWYERDKYGIEGTEFKWNHNTMSSEEAIFYVEYMFKNIVDSIFLPSHNFDTDAFFELIGTYNRDNVLDYIKYFNRMVLNDELDTYEMEALILRASIIGEN